MPAANDPFDEVRSEIVAYLRRHVVGPFDGPTEVLREQPHKRYLMGALYPENANSQEVLGEEVDESTGGATADDFSEDPVTLANSWLPSSIGLSFFVTSTTRVTCRVAASRYIAGRANRKSVFQRSALAEADAPCSITISRGDASADERVRRGSEVFDGRAYVDSFWRPVGDGYLVTVTLRNTQRQADPSKVDPELCLLQASLECEPLGGKIREYPSATFLSRDIEDSELRLLHRGAKVFGIGHGCAVAWDSDGATASRIRTQLLPTFEVPAIVSGGVETDVLRLSYLADESIPPETLRAELRSFVGLYKEWIASLKSSNRDIPPQLQSAADGIMGRLESAAARMERGVDFLTGDPRALLAFRLANRAMLVQMHRSKPEVAGTRRQRDTVEYEPVDYSALDHTWRPFQLAFQLLTLPSVLDPEDEDRDVVDLLWFPTGGGKTEAYLAVAAAEIFSRRLQFGDAGAGTTVITRYTLRLLTAQQFQRAAALICACELLRREYAAEMGTTPISIGLWVGDAVTPNKFSKAVEKLTEIYEAPFPTNPFQLEQCPWCGTTIVPDKQDEDTAAYGIRATQSAFDFFCPSSACPFHERLPVAVVDEELYQHPPTFLLATVDKFARLAWEERGGVFFGSQACRPPSLIIQDEMHLLGGPLGTTVAVYEGAVEALMTYHGARPKILASTATIRRASEQSLALFGRRVHLFPPSGLTAADSYFAKADTTRPGRLYVGLMSQSHTPHTTIVHTAAALLQAPVELTLSGEAEDAYWTLVAYHNSLRELGRTITLARDDIPARIKVIASDQSLIRDLGDDSVVELTGNVSGFELPEILERVKRPVGSPGAISVLATTNMLSVGVDVPRLGLMLMNGQPKTTSEYIQATSRVGRATVPGLVVTLYVSTKPRDRSHYEGFGPYHSALYRYVEPTSVTPFSAPSRERALHAALVVLVRHGVGLSANDDASRFRASDDAVERAIQSLESRIELIDPRELAASSEQLRTLAAQWEKLAKETADDGKKLYYQASKPHVALLRNFGDDRRGWATLHSMRNVDRECVVTVLGEDR